MKTLILITILFSVPSLFFAQKVQSLELVGPAHEGYIPVMKNNQWGILNDEGELVVDFRSDLIYNSTPGTNLDMGIASIKYPKLSDNRAIIKKVSNRIPYYGFIDSTGTTVIEPEYLNVSNFKNGHAFALKIEERFLGNNNLLNIKIKSYFFDVVLIDKWGKVIEYLAGPFPVAVSEKKLNVAPSIVAKWVGDDLVAVKTPEKKWNIFKIGSGNKTPDRN